MRYCRSSRIISLGTAHCVSGRIWRRRKHVLVTVRIHAPKLHFGRFRRKSNSICCIFEYAYQIQNKLTHNCVWSVHFLCMTSHWHRKYCKSLKYAIRNCSPRRIIRSIEARGRIFKWIRSESAICLITHAKSLHDASILWKIVCTVPTNGWNIKCQKGAQSAGVLLLAYSYRILSCASVCIDVALQIRRICNACKRKTTNVSVSLN